MSDHPDRPAHPRVPALPPEVSEADASGRIAELYDEIRPALRSPNVNLVYRLLANYPAYLAAAWEQIGPNIASRYLEREAERLRALAALDVGPAGGRLRPELSSRGISDRDLAEIRGIIDLFNYANPKNLIGISALRMAMDGRPVPGAGDVEDGRPVPEQPLPDIEVRIVDMRSAAPDVRAVLEEVAAAHETGEAMPSVYRALASWPPFLRASWRAVRPFVGRPEFAARVGRLVAEAERSAVGLPYPVRLSRAETEQLVGKDAADSITEILRRFQTKMIPPMTVEIHTLKALLDGQEAATSSPLTWKPWPSPRPTE